MTQFKEPDPASHHAPPHPAHRRTGAPLVAPDPRRPGPAILRQEIRHDRRAERWVILKFVLALAVVAGLVVLGQVYSQ